MRVKISYTITVDRDTREAIAGCIDCGPEPGPATAEDVRRWVEQEIDHALFQVVDNQ